MDMEKSVGTILREARLAKGLSLIDVEKGTSIRSRYLEAVENDEYAKTPGEVFLKGIIRNYGNFLGLDGLELVNMYKASVAGLAADKVRAAGIREVDKVKLNIQLKDPRDIGSGTGRMEMPSINMKQVLAGLLVVVVLAAGYFAIPGVINYFKNRSQPVAKQEQQAPAATNAGNTAVNAPVDKIQVDMEANGSCWLEVNADGREIFAGMLSAKDKKNYEAKEKLIIKFGNIGVIQLAVNGEPVNLQGEHGVAVKTYMLRNAKVVQEQVPQPVAVPAAETQAKEKSEVEPAIPATKSAPVAQNSVQETKEAAANTAAAANEQNSVQNKK